MTPPRKAPSAGMPGTAVSVEAQRKNSAEQLLRRLAIGLLIGALQFALWASLPTTGHAMNAAAEARPEEVTPANLMPLTGDSRRWQEWGSGEMRFFGFRLYRATLWVAGQGIENDPHALTLHYRRDISRRQLVDASLDEMRRQGEQLSDPERWRTELERVFPDVREGDRIIGLHLPGVGARFFHQGRPTGEITDAEFARRFFAIWLAPSTRSPEVRALLLKRPDGNSGG